MSDFNTAIQLVLANEGGYSNDPRDSGGETFMGISRVNHPDWAGWPMIDAIPNKFQPPLTADLTLRNLVLQFYHTNYWKFEAVEDNRVACKLLDASVNMGGTAIKMLQVLLQVPADGVFGPATATAVNAANADVLLSKFRRACIGHYFDIVEKNPKQVVFLRGWCLRAGQ